jgi:hypothetical protein
MTPQTNQSEPGGGFLRRVRQGMGGLQCVLHAESDRSAQGEPLLEVKTLADYTVSMKGIFTVLTDAH